MKLISLNIWGGKVFKPLLDFLTEYSDKVDVFCFQEVFNTSSKRKTSNGARVNIFSEIASTLPKFQGYFAPAETGLDFEGPVDFNLSFGLATFVRNSLQVDSCGDVVIYEGKNALDHGAMPRNIQHIHLKEKSPVTLFNLHGLWSPDGKGDNEDRLLQSAKTRKLLDKTNGPIVLCGDFNLLPETQSLKILEDGMKNLVKEFNVSSTRSRLYKKDDKFADYILVSPEIRVRKFQVLDVVVSDHLPLLLDFET